METMRLKHKNGLAKIPAVSHQFASKQVLKRPSRSEKTTKLGWDLLAIFTMRTNQQHISKGNWLKTRNLSNYKMIQYSEHFFKQICGQESCDLIKK